MLFKQKAPELKAVQWFNSKPLKIAELKGKVVMADFWTYSCVNCLRTLPHMRELWKKYKDKGLIIIGVNTPEFEFEKDLGNIEAAMKRLGIAYPVAVDSNYDIWRTFNNSYWPRQYFIDKDGYVRHDHIGEGGEEEIEMWIAKLLRETGQDVEFEQKEGEKEISDHNILQTPETYAGSLRNEVLGGGVCLPDGRCIYKDSSDHKSGVIYLDGDWTQEKEFAHHTSDKEGYILLPYAAKEANAVMSSKGKIKAEILLDNKPLKKDQAGSDIIFEDKKSFVVIDRPDMYNLVRTKNFEEHELKIVTNSPHFKLYAYTFG